MKIISIFDALLLMITINYIFNLPSVLQVHRNIFDVRFMKRPKKTALFRAVIFLVPADVSK